MKKALCIIIFFGFILPAHSQETSVETSIYGVQTGFLGLWVHHEGKMTQALAMRTEIGLDAGIWGGTFYDNVGYILIPVITIEPRWYYNLQKREAKGRRTMGNSGNFLSLNTSFRPDWFVISNYANSSVTTNISMVPTWGIRRGLGQHINFEFGIGMGYGYFFAKQQGSPENVHGLVGNFHLRIGYQF